MKIYYLIFFHVALIFFACLPSTRTISEKEEEIIESVIQKLDRSNVSTAVNILDEKIKKYNVKIDYMYKVQVLLVDKQFSNAALTAENAIKKYPDYVEMLSMRFVLGLYLEENDSERYYNSAINGYEKRLRDAKNNEEKYSNLLNMLMLASLCLDISKQTEYLNELKKINIQQEYLSSEYLLNQSRDEIFMGFGIYP
jgi:uncharacterized protein YicC (UPF0701 family)